MSQASIGQLLTVGISEGITSDDSSASLITYSLGSCLGVSFYDPELKLGALIHCMLPLSKKDSESAESEPYKFVDVGVVKILQELFALGASKERLVVKAAGCANVIGGEDRFKIGKRNQSVLRKLLWKNDLILSSEDLAGTCPRTMRLDLADGRTWIKSGDKEYELE